MPGSPPISTKEPGASPPPKVLSNSEFAVLKRFVSVVAISFNAIGLPSYCTAWLKPRFRESLVFACSTRELQAPQEGHFPAHFEEMLPHSLHTYSERIFSFGILHKIANIFTKVNILVIFCAVFFKVLSSQFIHIFRYSKVFSFRKPPGSCFSAS